MKKKFLFIIALIMLLSSVVATSPNEKRIIMHVNLCENPYFDTRFDRQLVNEFTLNSSYEIIQPGWNDDMNPDFPADMFNADSLFNWGKEVGGNFLVFVNVTSHRLEKRKTFSIPIIMHKYQTYGVIEGDLRIYDLSRERVLLADRFKVEKKGPRVIQMDMDNNKNDPDLHLNSVEKIKFFKRLEEVASHKIYEMSRRYLGRR